jgi:hypothetical protein
MSGNEFKLPDDLGWKCNDAVHKCIADWLGKVARAQKGYDYDSTEDFKLYMEVAIAELSDDVYAIIKQYQKKVKKS